VVYLGKTVTKEMYFGAKAELFALALKMRRNPTLGEKALWELLRTYRFKGSVFRRQNPVSLFIADFYCHKLKLVIEVDGEYHEKEDILRYDDQRSGELERLGINVIRFKNEEILNSTDQVVSTILLKISELSSPSHPGEGTGGGDAIWGGK
jgi:very-short-patch-repair endonuclease